MQTYDLLNPYFANGWTDWGMVRTNADEHIGTYDGSKYGLITDKSLGGVVPVGRKWMLLAGTLTIDGDATANTILLKSSTLYNFAVGDIVDVGIYCEQYTAVAADDFIWYMGLINGSDAATIIAKQAVTAAFAGNPRRLVGIVPASVSGVPQKIGIQITTAAAASNTAVLKLCAVTDVRVYPALKRYALSDADDTTGVT